MPTVDELNKQIGKLIKERDKELARINEPNIGKCYHVPDTDIWIKITGIEKRTYLTLELDAENIVVAHREFDNPIFYGGRLVSEEEFDDAFDLLALKLKGGKK